MLRTRLKYLLVFLVSIVHTSNSLCIKLSVILAYLCSATTTATSTFFPYNNMLTMIMRLKLKRKTKLTKNNNIIMIIVSSIAQSTFFLHRLSHINCGAVHSPMWAAHFNLRANNRSSITIRARLTMSKNIFLHHVAYSLIPDSERIAILVRVARIRVQVRTSCISIEFCTYIHEAYSLPS